MNCCEKRTIRLTASMVKSYKACQRKFEFEYIEMLKPEREPDALSTGSNYHNCVEKILKGQPYEAAGVVGSMAKAFEKFAPWREWDVAGIEKEFEVRLKPGFYLKGKFDAVLRDGTPVEHKTAASVGEKYIDHLAWDDQVSVYLLALSLMNREPIRNVIYTVCQKPTIRLKQNETGDEYLKRVEEWYDPTKIQVLTVTRSADELREKYDEIISLAREMRNRKTFYRNPAHCSLIGCEYSPICLKYDPSISIGFVKKERRNEELCKF